MSTKNAKILITDEKEGGTSMQLSPALKGSEMSHEAFLNLIENAENQPTISLKEAKDKWISKRKHLQQSIR